MRQKYIESTYQVGCVVNFSSQNAKSVKMPGRLYPGIFSAIPGLVVSQWSNILFIFFLSTVAYDFSIEIQIACETSMEL